MTSPVCSYHGGERKLLCAGRVCPLLGLPVQQSMGSGSPRRLHSPCVTDGTHLRLSPGCLALTAPVFAGVACVRLTPGAKRGVLNPSVLRTQFIFFFCPNVFFPPLPRKPSDQQQLTKQTAAVTFIACSVRSLSMPSRRTRQMFGDFCSAETGPGHDKAERRMHGGRCGGQAVMVTLLNFTWGIADLQVHSPCQQRS